MRLEVDREVCIGAGMCVLHAPDVFEQDADDGLVVVADGAGEADGAAPGVRRAVAVCPSGAIALVP